MYLNADRIYFYDNFSLARMKPGIILYKNGLKTASYIRVQQIPLISESPLNILQFYI
jgi:hypothetical protein